MRNKLRATFIAVAVLLAAVAGFLLYQSGTANTRPVFELPDLEGNTRSITEWDGKILLVNFWATWCAPCRREIPLLNDLQAEYREEGVQIIGIAIDDAKLVAEYANEIGIVYPVLVGEQEAIDVLRGFGTDFEGLPISVFVDRDGKIVGIHVAELKRPEAVAALEALL